jgi:hypothetical protein
MSFGHTNAPSTFQSLMKSIFKPLLRNFLLVFFDDILIYKKYWEDHVQHIDRVLQQLEEKKIYANSSKCAFGVQEVEYLGHFVSHEGLKLDPHKIKAMREWPIPKILNKLRGFLRLIGYYQKFVKKYGQIAAPITSLLKKEAFSWTEAATKSFEIISRLCVQLLS